MDEVEVFITLCDPLNPGFGYSIKISCRDTILLHTSRHPISGTSMTYHDALSVATMYGSPNKETK